MERESERVRERDQVKTMRQLSVIVGLGNPGKQYEGNRHNVGWMVVDRLAAQFAVTVGRRRAGALSGEGVVEGRHILLVKPETFVNRSGRAVAGLLRHTNAVPGDVVVVYDDLDLPLAKIRIKSRGTSGGHRGVQSIIEALGTVGFPRVRVGIGRPPVGRDPADFVLADFRKGERPQIEEALETACRAAVDIVTKGVPAAMNEHNKKLD